MSQHADTYKDAALRMVGRTVVNFQRLEHNLKLAARLGPLQGTIPRVQRDIAKRHERASTLTLGQAIQAWLLNCDEPPAQSTGTPDLFDVTVQMTFAFESDAESRAHNAKALRELLDVRNELIHSRLAKFEWESPQECNNLVAELEQVNAAISRQIEYTSSLLAAIAELHRDHAGLLAAVFERGDALDAEAKPDTLPERSNEG
jgi:hypothetical protein